MSTLNKVCEWMQQRDSLAQELVDELIELAPAAVTARERKYYPQAFVDRIRALHEVSGWGPDAISMNILAAGGPRVSRHTMTAWLYAAPRRTGPV
jgi:hypothetical protein